MHIHQAVIRWSIMNCCAVGVLLLISSAFALQPPYGTREEVIKYPFPLSQYENFIDVQLPLLFDGRANVTVRQTVDYLVYVIEETYPVEKGQKQLHIPILKLTNATIIIMEETGVSGVVHKMKSDQFDMNPQMTYTSPNGGHITIGCRGHVKETSYNCRVPCGEPTETKRCSLKELVCRQGLEGNDCQKVSKNATICNCQNGGECLYPYYKELHCKKDNSCATTKIEHFCECPKGFVGEKCELSATKEIKYHSTFFMEAEELLGQPITLKSAAVVKSTLEKLKTRKEMGSF